MRRDRRAVLVRERLGSSTMGEACRARSAARRVVSPKAAKVSGRCVGLRNGFDASAHAPFAPVAGSANGTGSDRPTARGSRKKGMHVVRGGALGF